MTRKRAKKRRDEFKATVSQETVTRLIDGACADHRFEGLDRSFITDWVTKRLALFITDYPWWYGRLEIDTPKPVRPRTEAQVLAFEKIRQKRRALHYEGQGAQECA